MLDTYEAMASAQIDRNKTKLSAMIPALENSSTISAFKNEADKYLYGKEDLDTCAANLLSALQ